MAHEPKNFFRPVAALLALAATANLAWAQSDNENSTAMEGNVVEEITVTAQKREQSVQDIPLTVNSEQGETLRDYTVFDFDELQKLTPGLNSQKINGRTGTVALRGVTYNPNSAAAQAVDVYWNDSSTGTLGAGGIFQQVFDVERIEVLRGPQGTLQGRTSPGGTVNIISAKPNLQEMTGYARTTFTDNSGNNTQFGVGIPLVSGQLAIRVAGVYDQSDLNEVRNILDGNVSDSETRAGRISVSWLPVDTVSVDFVYQQMKNELNQVTALAGSSALPLQPQALPTLNSNEFSGIELQPILYDGDFTNSSLTVEWELENHAVTYVGGFHKVDALSTLDTARGNANPGTPSPGFANPQIFDDDDESVSHELRLSSVANDVWDYTVGLYFGDESGAFTRDQLTSPFAIPITVPTPFDIKDFGVFNHNIFYFNDQWTGQLGLRWQSTERDVKSRIFAKVDIPPLGISAGDLMGNLLPGTLGDFESDEMTGSASISYNFDDPELMVYASAATSYRPGGASVANQSLLNLHTFNEEKSWHTEFGLKSTLMDGRLRLNGSVFYQDFDSFITRLPNIRINNGGDATRPASASITANGDAEILGLEIFADAVIGDNWNLTVGGTYTVAEYKNGVRLPCSDGNPIPDGTVANTCDVGGQALGAQPELSLNLSTDYTIPFQTSDAYVRALLNYSGNREDVNAPTSEKLSAYSVLDLYLGWRDQDLTWDVSIFARNVFDEDEVVSFLPELRTRVGSLGSGYWQPNLVPPQTIGISATYNF